MLFRSSEADYDLPILNLILSVLPKDNLSFGQDSTFLRKVPLAIAVNYAQENAFSRRADVTILEANLDPQREAQALEATWALWAKAEPGELYCDAATALEAGAQL